MDADLSVGSNIPGYDGFVNRNSIGEARSKGVESESVALEQEFLGSVRALARRGEIYGPRVIPAGTALLTLHRFDPVRIEALVEIILDESVFHVGTDLSPGNSMDVQKMPHGNVVRGDVLPLRPACEHQ